MKALAAIAVLSALGCAAQEVPQAPRPNQPVFQISDYVGIATLTAFHVGDIITTREFMNNPCKCMTEMNPIAPHGRALGPLLLYHGGWIAANTFITYKLEKHHHHLAAWAVRGTEIGVEMWAVRHNESSIDRVDRERAEGYTFKP